MKRMDATGRFMRIPRDRAAVQRARAWLERRVAHLPPEVRSEVVLLGHELVTNAVKYGVSGPVQVELSTGPSDFRAEVIDEGSGFHAPARDTSDLHTPGGWGLHLVEVLSDRWGTHEGSTHVWFELKK